MTYCSVALLHGDKKSINLKMDHRNNLLQKISRDNKTCQIQCHNCTSDNK